MKDSSSYYFTIMKKHSQYDVHILVPFSLNKRGEEPLLPKEIAARKNKTSGKIEGEECLPPNHGTVKSQKSSPKIEQVPGAYCYPFHYKP